VAEEVEKLYPELVTHAADGQVQSVRYTMLTGMLLNELQKQNSELRKQTATNQRQAEQIRCLSAQVTEEKVSRKRDIEALRNTFAERLGVLEQAMDKTNGRKLAAAFDR
jgi:hypothetical protein